LPAVTQKLGHFARAIQIGPDAQIHFYSFYRLLFGH
jgi:hypothetical protein